jgi:hypothetical protein
MGSLVWLRLVFAKKEGAIQEGSSCIFLQGGQLEMTVGQLAR